MRNGIFGLCGLVFLMLFVSATARADTLFAGRDIFLTREANKVLTVGLTGSTSGAHFIALNENASQESISLGQLGYWERVPDPPSFLRNTDLQLVVQNQAKDHFLIELTYQPETRDIAYRLLKGSVHIELDTSAYYPVLVVTGVRPEASAPETAAVSDDAGRMLFFDFNSFDTDLRVNYGKVKRVLSDPSYDVHFYYYEASGYSDYHFRIFSDTSQLDTEKMGLSLEDGSLAYYQKVLDNLKAAYGDKLSGHLILVTRFGKPHAAALKRYARDIGLGTHLDLSVWSYDDVP